MTIRISDIPFFIDSFEKNREKEISALFVGKYWAWSLVKSPVYFLLVNRLQDGEITIPVKSQQNGALKRYFRLLFSIPYLFCFFIFWALRGLLDGGQPLLYLMGRSVDKVLDKESGVFTNYLLKGFGYEDAGLKKISIEEPYKGDYREPGFHKTDYKLGLLMEVIPFWRRIYKYKSELVTTAAAINTLLEEHWNSYFEGGQKYPLNALLIRDVLVQFKVERNFYRSFFKLRRPALIIGLETPGYGMAAAAGELQIPLGDLQHGIIDRYHHQYNYRREFKPLKSRMSLPGFLILFGDFHKHVLMEAGFWEEQELEVVGSARMDMNRVQNFKSRKEFDASRQILFPTQWTVFGYSRDLLSYLTAAPLPCKILLKLHPLEPPENVDFYENIAQNYPDHFSIAGTDGDIFQLIAQTDLIIGFDSAALLDAVALGCPAITIATPSMPEGVHSYFGVDLLEPAIRIVPNSEPQQLKEMLHRMATDSVYFQEWVAQAKRLSDSLFKGAYDINCRELVKRKI